jgi:hypothetical protein
MHDCHAIACSEIRANRSAECRHKWIKTRCTRDLATEAVKTSCPEMAAFLVHIHYRPCVKDYTPFQED